MQGGHMLRCSSSAWAFAAGSVPSMYSPRRSTHSLQCWMGLVKPRFLSERADSLSGLLEKMHRSGGGFASFCGTLEEFSKFFRECARGAVEPALDRGHRQIQRRGDVLVGKAVHVLEQEHRPVVFGQLPDGLLDGLAQLV